MGEQRAAPRPPRAQLPRRGAQPVAARCGARPAGGWSSRGEPGHPPGATMLLIPALSLSPLPVWSGARQAPGFIVLRAFWLLRETSVWHPGLRVDSFHCAALGLRILPFSCGEWPWLLAWVCASFPVLDGGGHSGAPVFPLPLRALETDLEGGDLVLPLCCFPVEWRESDCKLMFDSVHVPGSPAFLRGLTVPGSCRPCHPQLAHISVRSA